MGSGVLCLPACYKRELGRNTNPACESELTGRPADHSLLGWPCSSRLRHAIGHGHHTFESQPTQHNNNNNIRTTNQRAEARVFAGRRINSRASARLARCCLSPARFAHLAAASRHLVSRRRRRRRSEEEEEEGGGELPLSSCAREHSDCVCIALHFTEPHLTSFHSPGLPMLMLPSRPTAAAAA